jgi:hypothetical protein
MTADRLSRQLSNHRSPAPARAAHIGNVLGARPLPSLSSLRTCARRLFAVIASLGLLLMGGPSHAVIPASERAVLRAIYTSTGGAGWGASTNWNGAVGTECTWLGVTCNAGDANVTEVNLNDNNLTGSLPPLTGLTALESFFVRDNQLTGSLPSLTGLTALEVFWAYNNQLTGNLPALTGLTALRDFSVNNNQLTGDLPTLTGLTALQDFYANRNQLTGTIPSLTGLTALDSFLVSNNQLTGSLPTLTGLTALRFFFAHNNQLTGTVPSLAGLALVAGGSLLCANRLTV